MVVPAAAITFSRESLFSDRGRLIYRYAPAKSRSKHKHTATFLAYSYNLLANVDYAEGLMPRRTIRILFLIVVS